jgi:uracil permease
MVLGLGGAVMPLSIGTLDLEIAGMALAAVAGIFLNMVLPDN